jgi:hypothetical protein
VSKLQKMLGSLPNFGIYVTPETIRIDLPVPDSSGGIELVRLPAGEWQRKAKEQALELAVLRAEKQAFQALKQTPREAMRSLAAMPEMSEVVVFCNQVSPLEAPAADDAE